MFNSLLKELTFGPVQSGPGFNEGQVSKPFGRNVGFFCAGTKIQVCAGTEIQVLALWFCEASNIHHSYYEDLHHYISPLLC